MMEMHNSKSDIVKSANKNSRLSARLSIIAAITVSPSLSRPLETYSQSG